MNAETLRSMPWVVARADVAAAPLAEKAGSGRSGRSLPPVLDACCGPRFMWFDPKDGRALFMDRRRETVKGEWGPGSKGRRDLQIDPDVLADFSAMPFPDESFLLVVLDPPHIRRLEMLGKVSATFGVLVPGWEEMLRAGFAECFRVLKPGGTLIFKWCEVEVPLDRVLALTPEKPLFGHRSGKKALTHWVAFLKGGGGAEQAGDEELWQQSGASSQIA